MCGELKIDIGCGKNKRAGYIGIDVIKLPEVDIVRNIENEGLPFCNNSAMHIVAENVLEHFRDLIKVMNEMHRVLDGGGILEGTVPRAGTDGAWRDPTHVRFFVESSFDYFLGKDDTGNVKYTQYGILPWEKIEISRPNNNGHIFFKLTPIK